MLSNGARAWLFIVCLVNFNFQVNFSYASDQVTSKKCPEIVLPISIDTTSELDDVNKSKNQNKPCEQQEEKKTKNPSELKEYKIGLDKHLYISTKASKNIKEKPRMTLKIKTPRANCQNLKKR